MSAEPSIADVAEHWREKYETVARNWVSTEEELMKVRAERDLYREALRRIERDARRSNVHTDRVQLIAKIAVAARAALSAHQEAPNG